MEEDPWLFRGCALVLQEFDGATTTPMSAPDRAPAWIQIHNVPNLYSTEEIVKQLAEKVGVDAVVEMRAISSNSSG